VRPLADATTDGPDHGAVRKRISGATTAAEPAILIVRFVVSTTQLESMVTSAAVSE
jgi:hypothetical protein